MKFNLKYTKLGNHFFFISNLAKWHFSCRQRYNEEWLKKTGPLNKEEKGALKNISKILKKYGFKQYLGTPFFTESDKNAWKRVKKNITDIEYKTLIKVFSIFEKRFEKIWDKNRYNLKKFTTLINKGEYKRKTQQSFKLINTCFGKNSCKKITVCLLMAPESQQGGGGANIGLERITLEIGDISKKGVDWILRILIHEITHICYQDNFNLILGSFIQSLPKKDYNNFKTINYFDDLHTALKELITSSIIGVGIIDELIFKFPLLNQLKRDIEYLDWTKFPLSSLLRKSAAIALYSLNKNYLKNKKSIDTNYLKQTWRFLKIFEQKYKKGRFKELSSL